MANRTIKFATNTETCTAPWDPAPWERFPQDATYLKRKCVACGGRCHGSPSNEGIPEPRRTVDRAKPQTAEGLIAESERIIKTVPRPPPFQAARIISPAEAQQRQREREKEAVERYRVEHGMPPEPVENKPHDLLRLYQFRKGPEPVEEPKTTKEVVEKAREIQVGLAAQGNTAGLRDPELAALIEKRVQIQEQIKLHELGKEFDKRYPPAYIKKLSEKMSYTQVTEHLQRNMEKLKEERENQT